MSAVGSDAGASVDREQVRTKILNIGHVLAAPGALALLSLVVVPTFAVVIIAMTDWQLGADSLNFIGLRNFWELLQDPAFYASLSNTGIYSLIVVPATVFLGLAVALLIESGSSFRAFYRAAHFLPVMATMAAMAIAWEVLLHPIIGMVTQALVWLGLPSTSWLRDEQTVLPALAVIGIWQNLGYAVVLFLAGLKVIPQDLYDAAAIDGADGTLDRLRTVTLPMLGPTLMFVTIIIGVRALEVFDIVNILTQGGPGHSSTVIMYTLYMESFVYLHTGRGAAIAVVFLIVVTSLTLFQARIMDRRVHYA